MARRSLIPWVERACLALAAAGLLFCGWSGWTLWQSGGNPQVELARDRDQALEAGRRQLAALNSIDGARVDAGLRLWRESTTGALHDELAGKEAENRQAIARTGTSAQASTVQAAVTAFDAGAGDAQIIASVRIQVTGSGGDVSVQHKRFQAGMTRTDSGWKVKSFAAIPAVAE
ncbi:hypothetical protein HII36_46895 [Nonomuraea sp. NN258]|uniref:hypothetical protein n=1 Tax=Nonomuraea antri TaxID=2730852 RepID=UPI0015687519|nr:hypothetical protein [Nonomuraea antri]NRQ39302.1 hypothetical protein [Nonomuraea antri]